MVRSLSLFAFCPCHAFHIMSSCASHLHTCSSHASEHFHERVLNFHEQVLNFLGMDRDLPSGLGTPSVDRLSSFVPFGVRLILQRLTGGPQWPRVCCSPTPLQSGPITNPKPLHPLGRSIMIAWPKTTLHLDSPSSLYL